MFVSTTKHWDWIITKNSTTVAKPREYINERLESLHLLL